MSVTPHPNGLPDWWIIRYYPNGRKKDPATGKPSNNDIKIPFAGSRDEAQVYHDKLIAARKSSKPVEITLLPTIGEAYSKFKAYYQNHVSPTTFNDFKSSWKNHIDPFFGNIRPAYLTPALIEEYKTLRLSQKDKRFKENGRAPKKKTINKEISYLSAMITWMSNAEQRMCPPVSFVIRGFPARQVKAPLPVVPSRADMIHLFRAAERQYRPLWIICYYGGLRKTEGTLLQGKHVNWSQGYMLITGKGSKERIVPIHRKSAVYLRKHFKEGYLFINPRSKKPWVDFKKAIQRACDKAKIGQHVYMHLLRHGFGTHGIQSGIGLRTMQMLMGHSTSQVTERYVTLAAQFLSEEVQKLGSKRNASKNGS